MPCPRGASAESISSPFLPAATFGAADGLSSPRLTWFISCRAFLAQSAVKAYFLPADGRPGRHVGRGVVSQHSFCTFDRLYGQGMPFIVGALSGRDAVMKLATLNDDVGGSTIFAGCRLELATGGLYRWLR